VKMLLAGGASSELTRYYIGGRYEVDVVGGTGKERLYLGGDAYSAPMVMERSGSEDWTVYNIGRDCLGSITHIATPDGTLVAEYSYDPWGRLRNQDTHEIYLPGTEPELLLGRFLSPDPYVQMPDFTQNFNRYAYALNNPMKYTDESGEFALSAAAIIGIAIASAAIIGGAVNLACNWESVNGFWQGAAVFSAGALYGGGMAAIGIYSGGIGWMALAGAGLGGLNSFTNSIVSQTGNNFSGAENIDWRLVGASTVSGAASGAVTGGIAPALASSSTLINGISSPILRSLVVSPIVSGTGHIVGGTAFNFCMGQNFENAFNNSLNGLWQSMAIGAGIGVISTTATCLATGVNPLNGKAINIDLRHGQELVSASELGIDSTIQRINQGEHFPHRNDGTIFHNKNNVLPTQIDGYYREYVHPTLGISGPGPQRIVIGAGGEWYYSPDHYGTFIRFKP